MLRNSAGVEMAGEKKASDFDFDKWSEELTESARSGYEKAKEGAPKEEPRNPPKSKPKPASKDD